VSRVGLILCLFTSLSGCAIGHLTGTSASRPGDIHEGLRDRASALSRTAWDRVKTSSSRLSAWATILMEGRSEQDFNGLAASSENAPATSYLALKSRECSTDAERLLAVVTDVRTKTQEADSFIAFAKSVEADARARIAALQSWPANTEADRHRRALVEDKRVIEQAVADLRHQKATFAEVERELRAAAKGLDTAPLKAALEGLGERITRLGTFASAMDA
jgi:hypothetical protein